MLSTCSKKIILFFYLREWQHWYNLRTKRYVKKITNQDDVALEPCIFVMKIPFRKKKDDVAPNQASSYSKILMAGETKLQKINKR
jgi:hypothetical protein